ncbi:MAG: AAA family ATPase [Polyangiaceae bacterium]|nr:AAA family ATPase [Polyangiaceae bacterium]
MTHHRDRSTDTPLDLLPTSRAAALDPGRGAGALHWRVDQIWGDGVGILGGPPKSTKSWCGLDLAVSLASATPFLGRFAALDPGPTLVYLAEDALSQVRARIAGICLHRRLDLSALDLHVITAPAVRLDQTADQSRLVATLDRLRPKLLLLDPLVRLHRLDENSSADISALLGYLRELQRRFDVAIVVVHHMRKSVRAHLGQALRGSGDLHAWNDHGAYLTRTGPGGERLRLTLEHRAAPALAPLELCLVSRDDGTATHLEIAASVTGGNGQEPPAAAATRSLHDRVVLALRQAGRPLSRVQLRDALRVNNNRLGTVLIDLERSGRVCRSDAGIAVLP